MGRCLISLPQIVHVVVADKLEHGPHFLSEGPEMAFQDIFLTAKPKHKLFRQLISIQL